MVAYVKIKKYLSKNGLMPDSLLFDRRFAQRYDTKIKEVEGNMRKFFLPSI